MTQQEPIPAEDTSRISITALHTGYTWYANGLSHPVFATRRGKILYKSSRPWMWMGNRILGIADLETSLLQRHIIIDHLLEEAVSQGRVRQVLELACGLSPRGLRFKSRERFKDLLYVEADLPDMARRKNTLLKNNGLLKENHHVAQVNILEPVGELSLENLAQEYLDPDLPLAIITEGIINYFDRTAMDPFWARIAGLLKSFSGGVYLTDNMPHARGHVFYPLLRAWNGIVAVLARGRMTMHFHSSRETREVFQSLGFSKTLVHEPEAFYRTLPLPKSRLPGFLRVVEARV